MEKESKCYICDLKENYILVQKYTCDFEDMVHKIFFYIFLVLIINLVLIIFKKNETIMPTRNIKILSYNKSDLEEENNVCSICLTNFEDKYNFVIKTNCTPVNHFFCYSCSKKWFVDNNNHTCPYCRQVVVEFL
jgi:hypothetical protein